MLSLLLLKFSRLYCVVALVDERVRNLLASQSQRETDYREISDGLCAPSSCRSAAPLDPLRSCPTLPKEVWLLVHLLSTFSVTIDRRQSDKAAYLEDCCM
ncbi:hypothetical protein N657DRAFT_429283 [Parathielavia appendiculata]|uniref:Secreted protein n=1 Tax=Parathielavia appendiculata TaxID=2587402 RepID=A0AAN6TZV4_9PEZI|nr:hypothetical protein N657DRAFT_429283 [Parathielavia appendiculata]